MALIAAGPSATQEQADMARAACDRVMVINRAYELAPWADAMYAADFRFWKEYADCIPDIPLKFCCEAQKVDGFNLWQTPGSHKSHHGLSTDPATIHYAGHSGFQALNVAYHLIGRGGRIYLIGYDCRYVDGQKHFHPDHGNNMANAPMAHAWARSYDSTVPQLAEAGIEVINATPGSAINCFPRGTL